MNNDLISLEILDQLVDKLLGPTEEWGANKIVDAAPKQFDKEGLRKILRAANSHAFILIRKVVGVAFIKDHHVVSDSDCDIAIRTHDMGDSIFDEES
jgi:hypothetical protein